MIDGSLPETGEEGVSQPEGGKVRQSVSLQQLQTSNLFPDTPSRVCPANIIDRD